ncbi:MAG TPA: hypothetical protein VMV49_16440, partial [Candidatus Deferrimicrobium sp.]|nr:hypothetical protein [Candidatus Deferrimicrobium sp.]
MNSWTKFQDKSFSEYYNKFEKKPTVDYTLFTKFASSLLSSKANSIMICDVGGGSGANTALLKQIFEIHFKRHVLTSIVCDISNAGLKRAIDKGSKAIKCSATNLP